MSAFKRLSWIWIAILATLLITTGGWIAAWRVDMHEIDRWQTLAREDSAKLTESIILAIERAQRRVLTFARSLPDDASQDLSYNNTAFLEEISALGMADPDLPLLGVALLGWTPADQRDAFLARRGLQAADEQQGAARFDSFISLYAHGTSERLMVGRDIAEDEILAGPVARSFRAAGIPFTGPSFSHPQGRATPIAVNHGDKSVVLGLLDLTALLTAIAQTSLQDGVSLAIEERESSGGSGDFVRIFQSDIPIGPPRLSFETRHAQGLVAWRFTWEVDDTFRGGVSSEMSDSLRWGSVLCSVLLAMIMGYANAARISKEVLGRERSILETTVERISEGYSVVGRDGRLITANSHYIKGYDLPKDLVQPGTPMRDIIRFRIDRGDFGKVDDADAFEAGLMEKFTQENMVTELQTLPNGRTLEIRHMRSLEGPLVSLYLDVTERRGDEEDRAEIVEALRQSEERYALAAAGANDGLWDWDLTTDTFYTSPRWQSMLGLQNQEARETKTRETSEIWFDNVHPKDIDELRMDLEEHLSGRTEHLQAEFRILHTDGAYLWALVRGLAFRDKIGNAIRMTGSLTDITERKRAEEKLVRDALYDTVTGLPNRALFLDRIDQERRRHSDPASNHYAVLLFDLDRFKVVNDSLGHHVGDTLLIEVARRLEVSVKLGDSVSRLSGDEFGVLLTDVSSEETALNEAKWLQSDLSAAFTLGNQEVFTSASVGIAMPSARFSNAEEMLRAADIAMYKAKEQGQAATVVFDSSMQTRAITQMQLENDLRRAVERGEIEMMYQPIINLETGKIAGVEALARWRHPDRGTVVPAEFIPLAENTGLINAIGAMALRLACRQMAQWRDILGEERPALMSVNLSSRQLQDPDMVREIERILTRENVLGSELKLEVTESMIMMNPEVTSRLLVELKQLGVALSIDDFGTGYSSLSYLHHFPFDTLKIDRSFVVSMEDKTENMEIIRSIALLAHSLGMDVIAEGIETERHLARLRELKCEYGQGYYFSTPCSAADITEMIQTGKTWDMPAIAQDGPATAATLH